MSLCLLLAGCSAFLSLTAHKEYLAHAQIVHSTSSLFLIDDSAENAYDAAHASPPVRVLLFGAYPWNAVVHQRHHHHNHDLDDLDRKASQGSRIPEPEDEWTYTQLKDNGWVEAMDEKHAKLVREDWLPEGVERVRNWEEVISWVAKYEQTA